MRPAIDQPRRSLVDPLLSEDRRCGLPTRAQQTLSARMSAPRTDMASCTGRSSNPGIAGLPSRRPIHALPAAGRRTLLVERRTGSMTRSRRRVRREGVRVTSCQARSNGRAHPLSTRITTPETDPHNGADDDSAIAGASVMLGVVALAPRPSDCVPPHRSSTQRCDRVRGAGDHSLAL